MDLSTNCCLPSRRVDLAGLVFPSPTLHHVTHGETASFLLTLKAANAKKNCINSHANEDPD